MLKPGVVIGFAVVCLLTGCSGDGGTGPNGPVDAAASPKDAAMAKTDSATPPQPDASQSPDASGGGGGDFANEPAGFTTVTSRPFSSLAQSCNDANAAEGWEPDEECQWHHISIVTDPMAPKSPTNVLQAFYPAGTTGGTTDATPGRIVKNFNAAQSVYVSIWVKLSANFVGNGTGTNKVFYVWQNNSPDFFMSAEGDGMGTLQPTGRYQGDLDKREQFFPNLVQNATVPRGEWQHWEILIKENTPGVQDGEFHLWVNGTKVSEYTDVGYLAGGQTVGFMKMDVEPIWGGLGSTLQADQFMYFDHVYVSKP
jgi:hypothetical protein